MSLNSLNRRDSIKTLAAFGAAGTLGGLSTLAQAQKPLTVGVIYVGPRDDFGYNQAQAQAAAEVKKMPGVKVVEEENVPETAAVQKTMTGMIAQDGASAAVPHLVRLLRPAHAGHGRQVPRRALLALRRHVDRGQAPEEHRQLLRLHRRVPVPQRRDRRPHEQERQDRLRRGQADSAGAAQHQRLPDGRALGQARHHLQRDLHRRLVAWPVKEAEATNSLADQGCDVFTMHVDGPKVVVETAAKRGKMVCGYHASQAKLAPNAYLTGAEWNWLTAYTDGDRRGPRRQAAPQLHPRRPEGRLREDVALRPDGDRRGEEERRRASRPRWWPAPSTSSRARSRTTRARTVIPAGKSLKQTDIALEGMNYLVEGVVGSHLMH